MGLFRKTVTAGLAAALCAPAILHARPPMPAPGRPFAKYVVIGRDDRCPRDSRPEQGILVCGLRPLTKTEVFILHGFSRCLAEKRSREAQAILASGYDEAGSRDALRKIASRGIDCAPIGRLKVSGILFAGAMAEALLRPLIRDGSLGDRVALDSAAPPLVARGEVEVMSLCTVRAAPEQVRALFATEAESDAETAAIRAMSAQLTGCLGHDIRLVTNRPALRAVLALAAWRLALNKAAVRAATEGGI
jgi:hypothetical protein